ncbi:MAG: ATP-binding protein [Gammaproteobacteria bacterium]|jgi:PAS domain S-box-containing protein
MPSSRKLHKISKKLILYIILFSSVVTAIVTIIQLYHQYVVDKSILNTNIKNINIGYREGIKNAVWLDDKIQLNSILEGIVGLPDIEYVEVRVDGKVYSSRGELTESNVVSSSFPLHYWYNNRMLTIGETYLEANLSAIYKRLISDAWTILGLNAVKTFIVATFMYFIFSRLVVVRLEKLSSFVRGYDIENMSDTLELPELDNGAHADEITDVAVALDKVQKHLSRSVKQLVGLKKTLDLTLDSIVMFHPADYRIFYANAGATALLGYDADELLKMTPMDFSDDMTESLFLGLARSSENTDNQAVDMDAYFRTKCGNPVPVRIMLQYLHPENEKPRYVFMARDISERLTAQREIQASLEEARAANLELESFSYSISHDLRAPLRSIDGFSLLLLQDYGCKLNHEGENYINRVRKNAQHMGLLIDDLLSLSQVTRGELHRKECDLSAMAESSIRKLQDGDPLRKITIDIAPGILGWVDKLLFQNLMDNLLGNAWKYTGKTNMPRIGFGSIMHDDEMIYFVKDNGAGFDMRYADKLFRAFQRLHKVDEFSGTGIGLATVSRILNRHGGRIWVEAEVSKGATFYFTIGKNQQLQAYDKSLQQA